MNSGRMDTRIEIGGYENIKDPITFISKRTWVKKYSTMSEKLNPVTRSVYNESLPQTEYTISFRIRYKKGLKSGMIVKYKGAEYQLLYTEDSTRLKHEMILRCKDVK
ncbi:phage head closure protein [Peribacillus sp. SIMBA_075]|uniref:phage head closure protein n=1 Tax=Peribacillus sp. SIMBA_075 TaxID=3085813 RepID=UPI003979D866